MEADDEWLHYCEEPRTRQFVLCNLKNLKEIQPRKLEVPYDSSYLFDSVQLKNLIYFSGGGSPATDTSPEQFYQIMIRVTITKKAPMDSIEIVKDKMASMNVVRANHTMLAANNKLLYVIGGTNTSGNLSSCEEYDIAANKWREVASLNEKKKWISACACKGRYIYVFGGAVGAEAQGTDMIECLDITNKAAKVWEVIKLSAGQDLWTKCFFVGAVTLEDNYFLLFGGVVKAAEKDHCIAFNPTTRKMEKRNPLLRPDAFYRTKWGVREGKAVIVGSHDGDLHIFDKKTGKWDLMVKSIWNPDYGLAPKSDTF